MLEFLLLILGLIGLWAGSELLIRGAISLAERYQVSDVVAGMAILAIGTDLPELFVAVDASLRSLAGEDLSGIVIGSAVGSSIGQFGLVFGAAGFIGLSPRPLRLALRSSVFLIGGLIALAVFSLDGTISRVEGWGLVACYGFYFLTLVMWRTVGAEEIGHGTETPLAQDVIFLLVGLVVLGFATELTVVHAVRFADLVGLSNLSVSAVIIGMGSSLPELSVCIVALMKNRGSLSVGNLMGSNVLDTLLVPGVGAVISPLAIPVTVLWLDVPVLALLTVLVLGFLYISPRGVKVAEACLILAIYASYVVVRIVG